MTTEQLEAEQTLLSEPASKYAILQPAGSESQSPELPPLQGPVLLFGDEDGDIDSPVLTSVSARGPQTLPISGGKPGGVKPGGVKSDIKSGSNSGGSIKK